MNQVSSAKPPSLFNMHKKRISYSYDENGNNIKTTFSEWKNNVWLKPDRYIGIYPNLRVNGIPIFAYSAYEAFASY